MGKKKLIIFGTGEIAELADCYFTHDSEYEVVGFVADDKFVNEASFRSRPLVKLSQVREKFPPSEYEAHVALSYKKLNRIREEKYTLMKELGYRLASYVCTKSVTWPDLTIGDNCFILENQTIQPTVKIGNNVMIWSGNHLGHGCEIRDHVYISSHVCISGHTIIGERCFLGVNCTFRDFIKVGSDVFVTMGALVAKDVAPGSVVIAAQSNIFEGGSELAEKLKKKYFDL